MVEKKWLTVQEAAEHVGVARATIYKWAREGRLTIYKLGERVARIRVEDLERLVAQARPLYASGHVGEAARARVLQKTKGAWADNPLIDQALAELNRG